MKEIAIRMLSKPWEYSAAYKDRENEYLHRAPKGNKCACCIQRHAQPSDWNKSPKNKINFKKSKKKKSREALEEYCIYHQKDRKGWFDGEV